MPAASPAAAVRRQCSPCNMPPAPMAAPSNQGNSVEGETAGTRQRRPWIQRLPAGLPPGLPGFSSSNIFGSMAEVLEP